MQFQWPLTISGSLSTSSLSVTLFLPLEEGGASKAIPAYYFCRSGLSCLLQIDFIFSNETLNSAL